MAKVTEYSRITKMKDNDVLLVDGPDGTRTILQTDASKQMGGEVIMVNETAGDSTKVVINTTDEDIVLATMADLEPVEEDVSELKESLEIKNVFPELVWIQGYVKEDGTTGASTRDCMTDYLYFYGSRGIIEVGEGYQIFVQKYDSSKISQGRIISNGTGTIVLEGTSENYYRITIETSNVARITPADIPSGTVTIVETSISDPTLTRAGKAADAKATGNAISNVLLEIDESRETYDNNLTGLTIEKNLEVGEYFFDYLFISGLEYTFKNYTSSGSGHIYLYRADDTYEDIGVIPSNERTLSYTPNEPFVKFRIYANEAGKYTIATDGLANTLYNKTGELLDGIGGSIIYTTVLSGTGYVQFPYQFIIGNTYEIYNVSARNTGVLYLYRADGTYKAFSGVTANTRKTFVPDEAYISIRFYCNAASTITVTDKGVGYQIISGSIKQNTASLSAMIESSVSRNGNYGYAHKIYPQLLVCTDIHADWDRLNRAFDYGDENDNSAFTLSLGDVVDNPTQFSEFDWKTVVMSHNKPILSILGNHDVMTYVMSGTSHRMTNAQLFEYFFNSDLQEHNGETHSGDSLYWFKDITKTYTDKDGSHTNILRIIGLNQFEFPPNEDGDRAQYIFYAQDQIDWLIDLLDNTPNNAYVMICCHSSPTKNATIQDNPWSAENVVGTYMTFYDNNSQGDPDMLMKIVDAWINGTTVNLTNTQTLSGETVTITVNHTFSAHTNKFAGWLCGHVHYDAYAIKEGYTNQKIIALNCTTARDSQQAGDLGRALYGKAQDCITLVSYDWDSGKIRLARLGADMTTSGKTRQMVVI